MEDNILPAVTELESRGTVDRNLLVKGLDGGKFWLPTAGVVDEGNGDAATSGSQSQRCDLYAKEVTYLL